MSLDDHQLANRKAWQGFAAEFVEPAERGWASNAPRWGVWGIPDDEVGLLPADLTGKRCIEIGCGAGYVSAWMAYRGGEVVGIDPTPNQLATARRLEEKHRLGVSFVEGFGESLPFPDGSFDFAISEYGAALWADPYRWVPEAARVLSAGASLILLTNHAFAITCMVDDETSPLSKTLQRPYLGLNRTTWADSAGEVEFHLPHGKWIELFRENGFAVERLVELGAPAGAESRYPWADPEWAQSWPTEEAWCVRKA